LAASGRWHSSPSISGAALDPAQISTGAAIFSTRHEPMLKFCEREKRSLLHLISLGWRTGVR
jgi:hypothetical protein